MFEKLINFDPEVLDLIKLCNLAVMEVKVNTNKRSTYPVFYFVDFQVLPPPWKH